MKTMQTGSKSVYEGGWICKKCGANRKEINITKNVCPNI